MKHKNSHLIVGYWSRLRRGRATPAQSDIDPRAIKRMLPSVFILDACRLSRPLYRLAGTAVCNRFGFELRGTDFLAHWEPRNREVLVLLLRQSLETKQPVCISSLGASAECAAVEIETILAPITFGSGEVCRFIGMLQILSDTSVLNGRAIVSQRLLGSQIVREDQTMSASQPSPPASPSAADRRRSRHLRLVASRDRPANLPFELDETMRNLIVALDIVPLPGRTGAP